MPIESNVPSKKRHLPDLADLPDLPKNLPQPPRTQDVSKKPLSYDLEAFLEIEKPKLYDYTVRMTGQVSRSVEALDLVLEGARREALPGKEALLFFLYRGVRGLLLDIWHADTQALVHGALQGDSQLQPVDRAFKRLDGLYREALWLKAHLEASPEFLSKVMGVSVQDAENLLIKALLTLEEVAVHFKGEDPESLIKKLPTHPFPQPLSGLTEDLSMVMKGIKTNPVGVGMRGFTLAFLLLLLLFGSYFMVPHLWQDTFSALKQSAETQWQALKGLLPVLHGSDILRKH